ncbi:MAG TPA: hypothetical protein DIU48_01865 [Acidobacteria bacterium]|nr:hypothetical protein [Acidobacteriota bacterium]
MRHTPPRHLLLVVLLGLHGCAVLQAEDFSSDIAIELFRPDNSPVLEGDTVSGTLRGQVTVQNSMMQHAQFYKNFRILIPDEAGQLIDSNDWLRTFTLDTSEFYDGENLISVHVHPMNTPGTPYIADMSVQAFKIATVNGRAAPRGDVQLPTMTIDPTMMSLLSSSLLDSKSFYTDYDAVTVFDDGRKIDVDQRGGESNSAQVIPHLGTSILGRFRWTDRALPFGDSMGRLITRAHLINFQTTTDTPARIVFFFNDACGRANYAFYNFMLPALSPEARRAYPLPSTDAKILNVSQGDEIVIPDDGVFSLQVEVTNPGRLGFEFATLSTWVGNRSVAATDLRPLIRAMTPGQTSVVVNVKIPAAEIQKLQISRDGGAGATAFALWNDFDRFRDSNLPASEHVHVSSIRTSSYPWP